MKIDSHHHFWKYHPVKDAWISEDMNILQRDFLPADFLPIIQNSGIDGVVMVQADQSEAETNFLLECARSNDVFKGVVGWIDIASDQLENKLEKYQSELLLKGFRHIVQAEPPGFLASKKFVNGVKCLAKRGYTYDLLINEKQLEEAYTFLKEVSETAVVIDHISKPDIKSQSKSNWEYYMRKIAELPHVYVKLSGMVTEADWSNWKTEDLRPYVDKCLEWFGPDRLMFGSDWPVCLLAGEYDEVKNALEDCLKELTSEEVNKIMGGTAIQFYQL